MRPLSVLFGPRIETRFVSTLCLLAAIAQVSLLLVVLVEFQGILTKEVSQRVALATVRAEQRYPQPAYPSHALPEGVLYLSTRGPEGTVEARSHLYQGPIWTFEEIRPRVPAVMETSRGRVLVFRRSTDDLDIWVAISEAEVGWPTWLVTAKLTLLAVVILGCSFLAALWLARRLLRPLSKFTEAMSVVSAGTLPTLPDPGEGEAGGADELGQFRFAFNLMVEQIQRNQRMERALLARDKMATVGRLAAAVAHETRNPLAAISSLTQMLGEEVKETPRLREYTQVVLAEVARLDNAIAQLLAYARPRDASFSKVSILTLLREVVVLFSFEARRRGVRLTLPDGETASSPPPEPDAPPAEEGPDEPRLMDPAQVKQVLVNLVSNALSHTPVGGQVSVGYGEGAARALRVWVEDTGPGVPEEERISIFEPFYSRRAGGTGLGLAIASRIAEYHGGRIEAEDGAGGVGARFVLTLPWLDSPPAQAAPILDAAGASPWPGLAQDPGAGEEDA